MGREVSQNVVQRTNHTHPSARAPVQGFCIGCIQLSRTRISCIPPARPSCLRVVHPCKERAVWLEVPFSKNALCELRPHPRNQIPSAGRNTQPL